MVPKGTVVVSQNQVINIHVLFFFICMWEANIALSYISRLFCPSFSSMIRFIRYLLFNLVQVGWNIRDYFQTLM